MGKPKDITGKRFGRLTAVGNTGKKYGTTYIWKCRCDCGNEVEMPLNSLQSSNTKSCGCLNKEVSHSNGVLHGQKNINKARDFVNENDRKEKTRLSALNETIYKNNRSGVKGVNWDPKTNMWRVRIMLKGKDVIDKRFPNKQDAINARKEAEEKYFKPILEKYGKTQ